MVDLNTLMTRWILSSWRRRVAAMDVRMAASLVQGPENVAESCRSVGISRTACYKWRAPF